MIAPEISFDLPDGLKLAIANAVTSFAKLEMAIEELIWELIGLSFAHGRLLTRMDTRPKFELVKKLVLDLVPEKDRKTIAPNIWQAMTILREDRNEIVHGTWVIFNGKPAIVSHRYSAPPDEIGTRSFSIDELKRFVRKAEMLEKLFANHIVSLRASRAKL
jgi:hypothetical protein